MLVCMCVHMYVCQQMCTQVYFLYNFVMKAVHQGLKYDNSLESCLKTLKLSLALGVKTCIC